MAAQIASRTRRLAWLAGFLGTGLVLVSTPALSGPSPYPGPGVAGGGPDLIPALVCLLVLMIAGLVGSSSGPPKGSPAKGRKEEAGNGSGSEPEGILEPILEGLEEGVLILEAEEGGNDFSVRGCNRASSDLLGESRDRLTGLRLGRFLSGASAEETLRRIRMVWSQGGEAILEAATKNGPIRGRLLKLPKDRVAVVFSVGAREEGEDIIRALPLAVIISGRDEKVCRLNPAAEDLTGWPAGEALGRKLDEVVCLARPRRTGPGPGLFSEVRLNERRTGPLEGLSLISKSGRKRSISVLSGPIRDRAGELLGAVHVLEDKSGLSCLTEELERAAKVESMALLAGGIAHDFNNLLAGISGNISLARLYAQPEQKLVEKLDLAQAAASRARDLTRQLISFARGGAPPKRDASLPELIKEASSFLVAGPQVKLDTDLEPELWPIRVDPGQMYQVLTNLLLNAEQAMPGGGKITISAENRRIDSGDGGQSLPWRHVLVPISDQGEGIAPEYLSKVFDPFFTTKENGTGLGLATVYSIIRDNDGYVFVDSEPGQGTTFYLLIPASKATEEGSDQADQAQDPAFEPPRILLMDDEPLVRQTATELLRHLGYRVETARDGVEAVELFFRARKQGDPFSCLIMDLYVPGGMGGLEAIRRIRRADSGVWAVVSSGHGEFPDLTGDRIHGPQAFLTKPYRLEDLRRIMTWVRGRSQGKKAG